ncbi:MAG: c-type cytochrome [Planctomycetota bacterium]
MADATRSRAATLTLTLLLVMGCTDEHSTPQNPGERAAKTPVAASPGAARERVEHARKVFLAECSGCHGERGRGDGPAAATLPVRPRNLTAERFKFRSTESGELPRRQDLFDTITSGLPGSGMPAFTFLPEADRWLLVDHVRALAGIEHEPEPTPIALGDEPPDDARSVARGRDVYVTLQCAKCHGEEGRGDGPSASTLKDELDRPIASRDLTNGTFRRAATAAEMNMRYRSGLDGTPMPSFTSSLSAEQGWDLSHYVRSLRRPADAWPSDLIEVGRRVVQEKTCFGCHVIEGKGAKVGPSLDVSAQKLRFDWVKGFLADPRTYGKVYPYLPYRMPDLKLQPREIEGICALFAKVAGRSYPEADEAATVKLDQANDGMLLYFLKCTECHNLGTVVPTPEAKRQGPDLINVTKRMRFEFIPTWVNNPQAIYPGTAMVNTNLTREQIDAVTAFIWKTSTEAQTRTP